MKTIFTLLSAVAVSLLLLSTPVFADDDVAPLIVDNGPVSVPEPGALPLLLAGAISIGIVAFRNKTKK